MPPRSITPPALPLNRLPSVCCCPCRPQEDWSLKDEWFLVGNGLDFVDEEEARASTPLVTVAGRTAGGGRERTWEHAQQTLGNTVFVAAGKQRRGDYSSRPSSSYLHPPGRFATNTSHASV